MSQVIRIDLDDGKYTYIFNQKDHKALHHGEEWRDLTGDNLVLHMGFKIEELQDRIAELEEENKMMHNAIEAAVFDHKALGEVKKDTVHEMNMYLVKKKSEKKLEHTQ